MTTLNTKGANKSEFLNEELQLIDRVMIVTRKTCPQLAT